MNESVVEGDDTPLIECWPIAPSFGLPFLFKSIEVMPVGCQTECCLHENQNIPVEMSIGERLFPVLFCQQLGRPMRHFHMDAFVTSILQRK